MIYFSLLQGSIFVNCKALVTMNQGLSKPQILSIGLSI